MSKTFSRMLAAASFLMIYTCFAGAQTSPDNVWTAVDEGSLAQRSVERTVIPSAYKIFALNHGLIDDGDTS